MCLLNGGFQLAPLLCGTACLGIMPPAMNNGLAHHACAHVEQHSLPLYPYLPGPENLRLDLPFPIEGLGAMRQVAFFPPCTQLSVT